ncbi:shikimate dehydrogenase [uncultured Eudoraea sp.]|uniref:shikimate dehydrogenase family protein n=1 Tax=uncultured Eudoraea sp. TaxID=1035614 RepID=UPI00262A759A|nr:shikimate dehydrogenase [uncultured Eudoraea sp.]
MAKTEQKIHSFGLIGKDISYSFSKTYFNNKFTSMNLVNHSYENFDLSKIEEFPALIKKHNTLKGLNVTIPYKEAIIPYLDSLNKKAERIGAVNTIKFTKDRLKGYNTDVYGFKKSFEPLLQKSHNKALILGTGGASKAVAFVLKELGISFKYVSRNPIGDQIGYAELNKKIISSYTVLINCTPLGTFPDTDAKPNIPYEFLNSNHLLFDLIYNPVKTAFLLSGERKGAIICNGEKMLELQAEKAWQIWNS